MRFIVEIICERNEEAEIGSLDDTVGRDSVIADLRSEIFDLYHLEAEGVPYRVTVFREIAE